MPDAQMEPAPGPPAAPTGPGGSSRRRTLLRIAGSIIAAGLLVYWLAQNWGEVAAAFGRVGLEGFLLALLLTLISRFSTVGRWHTLLRSADVPVTPRQSIELTFAGLFSANFLPTTVGGDLVRFAGGVRRGYDAAVITASLVADRLVGMAGMATALPLGLYQILTMPLPGAAPLPGTSGIPPTPFQGISPLLKRGQGGFLLPLGWGGFFLVLVAGPGWATPLRKAANWAWSLAGRVWASLLHALRLWLGRPRSLLVAYLFTWGHMLCVFLSVSLLFQRMGESIPFWRIAGCWAMSYFPTLLPVSINGLGVQELTLTFFFVQYGGVSTPAALAMATLMRVLPALASLPGALFLPGLLEERERPQMNEEREKPRINADGRR